jgi:hypothetical protein
MAALINCLQLTGKLSSVNHPDNQMYKKLNNHLINLISILFVGILFFIIHIIFPAETGEEKYSDFSMIQKYTELEFLNLNSPEDRLLLREALEIYDPQNTSSHDSLLAEIKRYLTNRMYATADSRELSQVIDSDKFVTILSMLIKFAAIYILVLLVTYYGVETFAVYRFVRDQYRLSFFNLCRLPVCP